MGRGLGNDFARAGELEVFSLSRSVLRSAKILVQNRAIPRNAARMLNGGNT